MIAKIYITMIALAGMALGQNIEPVDKVVDKEKHVLEITATRYAWRLLLDQDGSVFVNMGVMAETGARIPAKDKVIDYELFLSELKKIAVRESSEEFLYEINIYLDNGNGSLTGIEKFYCKQNPLMNYFLIACDKKWKDEGIRFQEWKKNSIILLKPLLDQK